MFNEPKIILKDMPDGFNGIYLTDKKHTFIYINSSLNRNEKVCTIAHELMHHQFYPDCNFYSCKNYYQLCQCNWIENRIDKKTAKWLIPDLVLETLVLPYINIYPLSVLAEDLSVTEELLKLRLEIYKERMKEK
jgi:Zn-dependent peptidase ImmA (M78 family)